MSEAPQPLKHNDVESKDDAVLQHEADEFQGENANVQFVAELLTRLRAKAFMWWTPEQLRQRWSATDRMRWLVQRPDVRQYTTTLLTGLAPRAGRRKDPEFQAGLIDSVIDSSDISALEFDDAFDPSTLAVYGPIAEFWRSFRESMPWDEDTPSHQELAAFLIEGLLTDRSSLKGHTRKPILTHWEVRTAIPSDVWNSRLPLDIRSAIDDARMERERNSPDDPFHAFDDLVIATPVVISTHVPLRVLARVLDVAERAMGFAAAPVAANPKPGNLARVALTGSRAEAAVPVARPTADGTARRAALRLPGDAAAASPPTPMSGRAEGTSPGIPLPKTAVLKKTADGTGPHAALAAVPAPVAAPAGEGETKS